MGLSGKLVSETNIKSDGDVFHEIFRERPHHVPNMSPEIQNCDLHHGEWGTVGSIIFWSYTHGNILPYNFHRYEEKKSVTYNLVEGDLMELYKTFKATVHVDTVGEDNLVTWTFVYEKLNKDVPDPHTLMDLCVKLTKDIESHHLTNA
ncbi:hypothetical protein MIMGU_mgv1a024291mg [Erythranthe guttata]|uniref:Bet v I/Major latex protein domain-containing protein n=1 Tax=Erythranthe guttata TaxID=4155 RepID=A0A022QWU4_ERYGU|nr:hypothetical protein MIMGU_mgv1a024291mg [Erythranthe guttata]